jgi:hypothetical protein
MRPNGGYERDEEDTNDVGRHRRDAMRQRHLEVASSNTDEAASAAQHEEKSDDMG